MYGTVISNEQLITILTTISVASIGALVTVYQIKKNRINNLKLKLRDKQEIAYEKIYSLFFDLFSDTINNKEYNNEQYKQRFIELKKVMLFHASDKILLLFITFSNETGDAQPRKTLKNILALMVQTRKEIGNKGKKIDEQTILRMLTQSEKDYLDLCQLLGYKIK